MVRVVDAHDCRIGHGQIDQPPAGRFRGRQCASDAIRFTVGGDAGGKHRTDTIYSQYLFPERSEAVMITLSYDELLRYTNGERERWRGWFSNHPAAMDSQVQPADSRLPTVGKLIDHIFLVERRHLQRLRQEPLSDSTGLSAQNAPPL